MPLGPGTRLGPYEILSAIGAGGMGEVYRARDTRLKRDVAVKILPESLASDPERLARFQREAEVLASLNHPHIAAIYGLEASDGVRALILELVEGDTLGERIAGGAIPADEAIPIARQICEALEAAHEQGVIHRDLKPANIKITPDGAVKVLDFGLAKLAGPPEGSRYVPSGPSEGGLSMSPTITSPAMVTGAGMLLGTAAYMAPEQAKGRPADKRADIWAFGCVLYEMLTGARAFPGDGVTETLAVILMREPDWSALPPATPPVFRVLLKNCLQKDRRQRIADISAVLFVLREHANLAATAQSAAPTRNRFRERLGWAIAALVTVTAVAVLLRSAARDRQTAQADTAVYRTTLVMKNASNAPIVAASGSGIIAVDRIMALSPDGQRLVYVARGANGTSLLWVRPFDSLTAQPLPGTDNGESPFWSPDNRFIGFFAGTELKRVDASGGPPITVCSVSGTHGGGTWSADDTIVFSDGTALRKVSAAGGPPSLVATPVQKNIVYQSPSFLPDGRHLLVRGADNQTYVRSLDASDEKRVGGGGNARFANGHLIFFRGGSLFAQPFDLSRLETSGEAVPIAEQVRGTPNGAAFSVSDTGVIVYQTGTALSQLTWFTRSGQANETVAAPGTFQTMAISPDGKRLIYGRRPDDGQGQNLWITDLTRGVTTRMTFGDTTDSDGAWSPDMSRIAYASVRQGGKSLYEMPSAGGAERLLLSVQGAAVSIDDWSPDGRFILYHVPTELWALPLDGDRKPFVAIKPRSGSIDQPGFSPDGKWIAYNSDESGRWEIYLSPFPSTGARWQVSSDGGVQPTWRRDGRELYFLSPDATLIAVDIRLGSSPELGTPRTLFRTKLVPSAQVDQYAPSPDGQRFLLMAPLGDVDEPPTVLVGWPALLKSAAGR